MRIDARAAAALLLAATAACAAPGTGRAGRTPRRSGKKAAAKPAATEAKTMSVLEWKGQYGGAPETGREVVTDAAGWERLWRGLGKPAPALDFSAYAAAAVFAGQKPTGGFTVRFDEPEPRGDDLLVRARVVAPTGFVTQAFAQPWAVRAFPRPKGRLIVEVVSQ